LEQEKIPFIKKEYIVSAKAFYELHGTKALVLSRFVPIVRTFVPFVAGIAQMNTAKFVLWTLLSAIIWVVPISFAGFFFGELPMVKNNFSAVVMAIVFISILPGIIAFINQKRKSG
jgi:membrane-associated protein